METKIRLLFYLFYYIISATSKTKPIILLDSVIETYTG